MAQFEVIGESESPTAMLFVVDFFGSGRAGGDKGGDVGRCCSTDDDLLSSFSGASSTF